MDHYQALKDLNENRLTKFEFALYVFKLMEAFLTDDVSYNFAEHFYTSERFHAGFLRYVPGASKTDDEDMDYLLELEKELSRRRTQARQAEMKKAQDADSSGGADAAQV